LAGYTNVLGQSGDYSVLRTAAFAASFRHAAIRPHPFSGSPAPDSAPGPGVTCLARMSAAAPKFAVIAHRGEHLANPENTIPAIEAAIRRGADFVEIDVRTTRDGGLVLRHKDSVDATADGQGAGASRSRPWTKRWRPCAAAAACIWPPSASPASGSSPHSSAMKSPAALSSTPSSTDCSN